MSQISQRPVWMHRQPVKTLKSQKIAKFLRKAPERRASIEALHAKFWPQSDVKVVRTYFYKAKKECGFVFDGKSVTLSEPA